MGSRARQKAASSSTPIELPWNRFLVSENEANSGQLNEDLQQESAKATSVVDFSRDTCPTYNSGCKYASASDMPSVFERLVRRGKLHSGRWLVPRLGVMRTGQGSAAGGLSGSVIFLARRPENVERCIRGSRETGVVIQHEASRDNQWH